LFATQQIYFRADEVPHLPTGDDPQPASSDYDLQGNINVEGFRP